MTCYSHTAVIGSIRFSFSHQRDESIGAICMDDNKNIKFLPENPADSFPFLEIYAAENCLIQAIWKVNLKELSMLKRLTLKHNEIKRINNDTFEDLLQLEILDLCKKINFT